MCEQVHCPDEGANHHQLPIAVAFWSIWMVSREEHLSLTQNLIQIHCSTHSVILNAMATQCTYSLKGVHRPHWLVQWIFNSVIFKIFKITEWVEQCICIRFWVKPEHSSMETIQVIQKATAMGNWWLAASSLQCAHSCITSLMQSFLAKHQITRWLSPAMAQIWCPATSGFSQN